MKIVILGSRGLVGDALSRNLEGDIIKVSKEKIDAKDGKLLSNFLSKEKAEGFYAIHKDKPFFDDLIEYMTSGPVIVQVLEGENAVEKYRKIMGATNPENAEKDTIRKEHALNIQENSVHGSDSNENAKIEIKYFFDESEIINN